MQFLMIFILPCNDSRVTLQAFHPNSVCLSGAEFPTMLKASMPTWPTPATAWPTHHSRNEGIDRHRISLWPKTNVSLLGMLRDGNNIVSIAVVLNFLSTDFPWPLWRTSYQQQLILHLCGCHSSRKLGAPSSLLCLQAEMHGVDFCLS